MLVPSLTAAKKNKHAQDSVIEGAQNHKIFMLGNKGNFILQGQPLRLEFSTKTTIKEVPDPMDYLSSVSSKIFYFKFVF